MIKTQGSITLPSGLQANSPLINVFIQSSTKFEPTIGIAQIGTISSEIVTITEAELDAEGNIITPAVTETVEHFNHILNLSSYLYTEPNPSFELVQTTVLEGLSLDYPEATFSIII